MTIEVLEAHLRRSLRRQGVALVKSRARNWTLDNQGGYRIIDPDHSWVVAGERFDLSIEDVDAWAAGQTT